LFTTDVRTQLLHLWFWREASIRAKAVKEWLFAEQ
jgi:hypothetical protein